MLLMTERNMGLAMMDWNINVDAKQTPITGYRQGT